MTEIVGPYDPRFSPLLERMGAAVDLGIMARGVVIEVRVDGCPVVSCALGTDGLGRTVTPRSVFAVYCSTKPMVALAVGSLVVTGELSWDDRLGDVVDGLTGATAACTVEQVLTHTAGLHGLRAEVMLPRAPSDRWAAATSHQPPPGWSAASDLAYSNFLGWYWLTRVIEGVTGRPAAEHIDRAVRRPLGLSDRVYVGMAEHEIDAVVERVAVNVDLTGPAPVPLLFERSPTLMRDPDLLAAGGYATMGGLCDLYDALLALWREPGGARGDLTGELVRDMVAPRVSGRYDPVMGREGSWGLGFMVDLGGHRFGGRVSRSSFGHSGNAGASFAFCDPVHGLTMGVLHAAKVDSSLAVRLRRGAFVDQVYDVLGLDRA